MSVPAGTALRAAGTAVRIGLRRAYAETATVAHQAWIYRRDRNPLLWCVPLAAVVALIGPR